MKKLLCIFSVLFCLNAMAGEPPFTDFEIDSLVRNKQGVLSAYYGVTIDVTERLVLRRERLATPAGTFDCVVVRERKKEDAPLHHLDNYVENWYVPGMGYVRHDVYSVNMELEQTEILQKVTPSSAR